MTFGSIYRFGLRWISCVGIAVLSLLVAASGLSSRNSEAAPVPVSSSGSSNVVELHIDGEIEPILADYIVDGIHRAAQEHASLILITISTPGGLDTSMREIIQTILQSPVPVVNYVTPTGSRAASAGFFILLSADVAAMSPGTDTGAASPILEVGGQPVQGDATLNKKILNEATAFLRSYVAKRGRNVDLAATAVTDAKAFTEKEALDGKLIDLIEPSQQALLAALNGRTITRFDGTTTQLALANPVVQVIEMTPRQKFLARIVQPDVFFILLIVGILGLYTEFTHPGLFAPGVIGGIAIVLALFSMQLLPVNFAGLLMIVLAVGLFVLEAKFPTHGVLGVGGFIAMLIGALMLIRSPITGMGVRLSTAFGVALPFALIAIFLMKAVLRSRSWKPATGTEELIGEEGEITEPVTSEAQMGMVRVHGELWRAAAPQSIPNGTRVRVRKVEGLTLQVEPLDPVPRVSS